MKSRRQRRPPPVLDDESTWLVDERSGPQDRVVAPNLTVGDLVAFHRRPPTPPGWCFEPSVPFGSTGPGQRPLVLHLYRPAAVTAGSSRPAIVLVHGGAWTAGHPFIHIRRAALLAARGWVAATVTYRRAGEALWPAALDDVQAAVAWLRDRAEVLGVDPARIAVAGDSAGGHLAALTALDPANQVAAAALWYPFTDLRAVPALQAEVSMLIHDRWL